MSRIPQPLAVGTLDDENVADGLHGITEMFTYAGIDETLSAWEFCRLYHTDIAKRVYGIKGKGQVFAIPPRHLWTNIVAFGLWCWMPLRHSVGVPLFLRNGYRPPKYNEAVQGADRSKHQWAAAGDIYPIDSTGLTGRDLRDAAIDLVLDQQDIDDDDGDGTSIYGLGLYWKNVHLDWGVRGRPKVWGSREKEWDVAEDERDAQPDTDDYDKGGVAA